MESCQTRGSLSNKTNLSKLGLLGAVLCFAWPVAPRLVAELAPCVTISSGAEMDTTTGSIQNIGQAVIGPASNGVVFMQAGAIACLTTVPVQCLLGDVNDDGLIDGLDIQDYTRVTITGVGTPQELCAANLDIPTFVVTLLNQ